jgi:hypothetical protein
MGAPSRDRCAIVARIPPGYMEVEKQKLCIFVRRGIQNSSRIPAASHQCRGLSRSR